MSRRTPAWDQIMAVLRAAPAPLRQRDIIARLERDRVEVTASYVACALIQMTRRRILLRTKPGPHYAWAINPDRTPARPKPAPIKEAPESNRREVARHLRESAEPQAPHEIAAATALPLDAVYAELRRLVRSCRAQRVHSPAGLRYRATGREGREGREEHEPIGAFRERVMRMLREAEAPLRNADIRMALDARNHPAVGARAATELGRLRRAGIADRVGASVATAWYLIGSRADPNSNDSPTPASPTAPAQHSSRGSSAAAAGAAPESFTHSQGAPA